MPYLKFVLTAAGLGVLGASVALVLCDVYRATQFWRLVPRREVRARPV